MFYDETPKTSSRRVKKTRNSRPAPRFVYISLHRAVRGAAADYPYVLIIRFIRILIILIRINNTNP